MSHRFTLRIAPALFCSLLSLHAAAQKPAAEPAPATHPTNEDDDTELSSDAPPSSAKSRC